MPMSSQAARALREAQKAHRPARSSFDQGYLRLPQAAVWKQPRVERVVTPPLPTKFAKHPLPIAQGRCVALQNRNGELWVAVENAQGRQWKPLSKVLSPALQKRWAETGF